MKASHHHTPISSFVVVVSILLAIGLALYLVAQGTVGYKSSAADNNFCLVSVGEVCGKHVNKKCPSTKKVMAEFRCIWGHVCNRGTCVFKCTALPGQQCGQRCAQYGSDLGDLKVNCQTGYVCSPVAGSHSVCVRSSNSDTSNSYPTPLQPTPTAPASTPTNPKPAR